MSKYISLLMLFALLFFVGCDEREREDFTKRNTLVYEQGPRRDLIVVSVEDIPKTNLSRIVVVSEKYPDDAKFSLIASKSSKKPNKGEKVAVVQVSYRINSDGIIRTFWALKE